MKEEHSSGIEHFVLVVIAAAMLYTACGAMMSLFGDYAFIGGIIALVIFCIYGYFVLTHYTSRFTYSLKNGQLRINRTIGKRNKEYEFACTDIVRTHYGKGASGFRKPKSCMCVSVFNRNHSLYIEYKDKAGAFRTVIIEPSEKLLRRIDKEREIK